MSEVINNDNLISWNNINYRCNKIIIKLDKLNSQLKIGNIQILGKTQFKKNHNIFKYGDEFEIISSSGEPELLTNCFDNNLKTEFSTSQEDNPYVQININKDLNFNIYKINIYSSVKTSISNIIPLQILLYDNDKLLRIATKSHKNKDIELNKLPPKIENDNYTYATRNISDFGDPNQIQEWTDIINNNSNDDFCRIVKDGKTNKEMMACSVLNSENEYQFKSIQGIDMGHPHTQYFKKYDEQSGTNFCRCIGKGKNSNVSCLKNTGTSFTDEFIPKNTPSPCQIYRGEELKNINLKKVKPDCNTFTEYLDPTKYKVDAGFYYNRINSYYLFKNTTLNNKKITLMNLIDVSNHKPRAGFPKILTKQVWGNFPSEFMTLIDSILYIGNDSIIVFKENKCIFYNLKNQYSYIPDYIHNTIIKNAKPKYISKIFPNLPFRKNISACANIDPFTTDYSRRYSIIENLINKRIGSNIQSITQQQITEISLFIMQNKQIFGLTDETINDSLFKIEQILVAPQTDLLNLIYKISFIINKYLIPKCYIFSDIKYAQYSLNINKVSQVTMYDINRENLNGYNSNKVDAYITFYDKPYIPS